jgi:hypothetical protein
LNGNPFDFLEFFRETVVLPKTTVSESQSKMENQKPKSTRKVSSTFSSLFFPLKLYYQLKVHKSSLPEETTDKVVTLLNDALDKFTIEKDVATYVKKKCDELGGT